VPHRQAEISDRKRSLVRPKWASEVFLPSGRHERSIAGVKFRRQSGVYLELNEYLTDSVFFWALRAQHRREINSDRKRSLDKPKWAFRSEFISRLCKRSSSKSKKKPTPFGVG